ncbi:MAG: hypothetical protein UC361_05825 [Bulleidia sp.]|jgi:hypothetical protein|nr:hypothetical protein [Erysipelotrichaceae bacterium 7770_A6]MCI7724108.1 hypothetical protein [Erysipelotrichaceae bacterium]MDY3659352.1 hypothetical protein [Bulleidia sp.]MDD7058927.1 hypothetical protein [Erysipelotrichaceae bacterium]MEE0558940.1 hypothetical protein [Bulleidia sp.]
MRYEDVVSNVNVYGFEEAVKGAKYSYAIDTNAVTSEVTKTTLSLANSKAGSGHDQFMTGIIVQFDLTFSNKAWVEAERYKFLNFISSQSTMHRITKFDLDQAYLPYVDNRIVEIMKEKVKAYNELQAQMTSFKNEGKDVSEMMNTLNEMYLEILYSNPAGFRLTAKMTTNYRALKTIYNQRKDHRLPEWRAFCEWVKTLPHSEFITGTQIEL